MSSGLYNFNLTDYTVIMILTYLAIKVVYQSYTTYIELNEGFTSDIQINNYSNTLLDNTSRMRLSFPGRYKQTIYRSYTIPENNMSVALSFIHPVINTTNLKLNLNYQFESLEAFIMREYKSGNIININFFVTDPLRMITNLMNLEIALPEGGQVYINNLRLDNGSSNKSFKNII